MKSTCCGAWTPWLLSLGSSVQELQLLKPAHFEAHALQQEGPLQQDTTARGQSHVPQLEKAWTQQQSLSAAKNLNMYIYIERDRSQPILGSTGRMHKWIICLLFSSLYKGDQIEIKPRNTSPRDSILTTRLGSRIRQTQAWKLGSTTHYLYDFG